MKRPTISCPWDDESYIGDEGVIEVYPTPSTPPPPKTPKSSSAKAKDKKSLYARAKSKKSSLAVVPKQLQSTDLITCRDKVSNVLFSPDSTILWEDIISGKVPVKVIEKEWRTIYPPQGKPRTISKSIATVTVQLGIRTAVDECIKQAIMTEQLGEFDRIVLEACMTHMYHGQYGIAISTIYKYLGGNGDPCPATRRAIWNSIDKMRHIDVVIDATEAYEKLERLHNTDGTPKRKPIKVSPKWSDVIEEEEQHPQKRAKDKNQFIIKGYLLPVEDVSISCNGLEFEGIRFLGVSPVFAYAKDKGETDVISQRLIQAAKRRATKNFIALKSYILGRIRSIQRNRAAGGDNLQATLTFDALYNNCGDPEKAKEDSKFRLRIRQATIEYLEVLVEEHEIESFVPVDRNNQRRDNLADCTKIQIFFPVPRRKNRK